MADPDPAKQFSAKMLGIYTGAVLTNLIDIGYQTGLFESSRLGPASSEELSERAGLNERYVREWLGAMTTGGIYTYDALTQRYTLPEEHARADRRRRVQPVPGEPHHQPLRHTSAGADALFS